MVATPADERMLDAWGRLSPFAGRQCCAVVAVVSSARMLDAPPTTSISSVPIAFSSSPAAGKA